MRKCKRRNVNAFSKPKSANWKMQTRKCDLENENCKQENANRLLKIAENVFSIL